MSSVMEVVNSIGKISTVQDVAFMVGLFRGMHVSGKLIMRSPLFTICLSAISGLLTAGAATFVAIILPEKFRFIVPLSLITYVFYSMVYLGKFEKSEKSEKSE